MYCRIIEGDLARPEHAAAVVALLDAYASDPMGGGKGLSPHAKENLVAELRKRPVHVVLAFVASQPVGLILCFEGFSTFACRPLLNVHDVVVLPDHRGKGVCTRMLERVEAIAKRLGCCKLTLEVLEGNAPAQAVYRAFGFAGYELDPRLGRAMFWEKKLTSSGP